MKHYQKLSAIFQQAKNLSSALRILAWDKAVIMPAGSVDTRAEQLVTLSTLANQLITSSETQELLAAVDLKVLDYWQQVNVREMQKLSQWLTIIPEQLMQAFIHATTKCEMVWQVLKSTGNYQDFVPYFQEVVDRVREIASIRAKHFNCSLYEACLENYSPGVKVVELEALFSELQRFLPSFIEQAIEVQQANLLNIPADCLKLDLKSQKQLGMQVMSVLGFDFNNGRLDTSVHPFCTGILGDVRITTRYDINDFTSGLFAIIHETGHALYEQGLPKAWAYQPIGEPLGMDVHESQSLFMEMQVGRSYAFAKLLERLLINTIGKNSALTADNLFKVSNKVQPSFIRVDADEVTYPAHIIIRYQLEQAILSGALALKDLPGAWEDSMQKLLGIKPNNNQEGCMQDIHWPSGAFGYFPSYTMGAIIAAQLFAKLNIDVPETIQDIEQGNFQHIRTWLREKVHKFGKRYTTNELLYNIMGKKLDITAYLNYLQRKFIYR